VCGRLTLKTPIGTWLSSRFPQLSLRGIDQYQPRYNICPTQPVLILSCDQRKVWQIEVARWGLVPSWAKSISDVGSTFNARTETVHQKPTFRDSAKRGRCWIIADGYYEWLQRDGSKIPFWVHRNDEEPMFFAGLCAENATTSNVASRNVQAVLPFMQEDFELASMYEATNRSTLVSATLLTQEATGTLKELHQRMPCITFDPVVVTSWCEPTQDTVADVARLVDATNNLDHLVFWPVSQRVNSNRVDEPGLMKKVN
jgi:putative SOS response-associated peptidase YedK